MSAHTKGPWRYGWATTQGITGPRAAPGVHLDGSGIRYVPIHVKGADGDLPVAWLLTTDKSEDLDADGRLISAAPDLLEALQAIEFALRMPGVTAGEVLDENSPIRAGIQLAIAKATGSAK